MSFGHEMFDIGSQQLYQEREALRWSWRETTQASRNNAPPKNHEIVKREDPNQ